MLIFHLCPHFFCDVISASDDIDVGGLGDGDDILDVFRRRSRAVREEEGIEVGALGHTELGDR